MNGEQPPGEPANQHTNNARHETDENTNIIDQGEPNEKNDAPQIKSSYHNNPPEGFFKTTVSRFRYWWRDPYRDKPKWTDRAVAFLTIGIVILAGMQWKEMDDSAKQTDKIIRAANLIEGHQNQIVLDNKQVLVDNRKSLADSLSENRRELANVLQQNRDALEASKRQSKAALDESTDAARHEYRPWVVFDPGLMLLPGGHTADSAIPPEPATPIILRPNEEFVGRVVLKNIGRSPARRVTARIGLFYGEPRTPAQINDFGERGFQAAIADTTTPRQVSTIAPTDIKGAFSNIHAGLTGASIDNVTQGIGALLLAGEITYLDSENMTHKTEVCVLFTGQDMRRFVNCGVRFDMD